MSKQQDYFYEDNKCPECDKNIFYEWQSELLMCESCNWDSWTKPTPEEIEESQVKYLEWLTEHP